jgi:hypothetical protein
VSISLPLGSVTSSIGATLTTFACLTIFLFWD